MCFNKLSRIWTSISKAFGRTLLSMSLNEYFFERRRKAVVTRYYGLQCITRCYNNNAAQELIWKLLKSSFTFWKRWYAVVTCYSKLHCVTSGYKKQACALLSMLLKKSFSWRKGKSCYNTLQWVTMRYKLLQKQRSPRTSLRVIQKVFLFLKERISC